MKLQKIAVADILMDKPNAEDRTFSKEFAESLARSIESDGLLHEPIVRPVPDQPGKYKELTGRHRIYAMGKVLKYETIPCKIAPANMTEDEAVAIEDAENLWRLGLDDAQTKKALIRWQKIYDAKHPAASGRGADAKRAKIVREKVAEAQAQANGEPVDEKKIAEQVAADNKSFMQVIQETLKVSRATAARLARVARNLEPEQIDVLSKHKVTDNITDQLAGLGDREAIVKAINLIASGMDHAEAVRQAAKPVREKKAAEKKGPPTREQAQVAANARKAAAKAPPAPKAPKDKELTDEEWLAQHCDPILKGLKRKGPFKRDAILYRRLKDTLPKLRTSSKKALAEAKSSDGNGGFFGALVRVVKAAHPSNWLICGGCNGTGHVTAPDKEGRESKQTCTQCHGAAYKLKLED
jgi:ParB-like chromosome segregation protein Spo0J